MMSCNPCIHRLFLRQPKQKVEHADQGHYGWRPLRYRGREGRCTCNRSGEETFQETPRQEATTPSTVEKGCPRGTRELSHTSSKSASLRRSPVWGLYALPQTQGRTPLFAEHGCELRVAACCRRSEIRPHQM